MLRNAQEFKVYTATPKFKGEYSAEMSDILKSMGMTDAFEIGLANFTKLGQSDDGNIFISRVIHKTFIVMDEKGTKAAAATVVEQAGGASQPQAVEEYKTVRLDRPFIYMIIDCETSLPVFIGTVTDTI